MHKEEVAIICKRGTIYKIDLFTTMDLKRNLGSGKVIFSIGHEMDLHHGKKSFLYIIARLNIGK